MGIWNVTSIHSLCKLGRPQSSKTLLKHLLKDRLIFTIFAFWQIQLGMHYNWEPAIFIKYFDSADVHRKNLANNVFPQSSFKYAIFIGGQTLRQWIRIIRLL